MLYTVPPPKNADNQTEGVEPDKDQVNAMAQRLFEHFSQMRLNQDQWLKCLNDFLAEAESNQNTPVGRQEIEAKIAAILRDDKHLPMQQLSEDAQKAVYREVAEWLVAEKLCEKMLGYERSVIEGLENGRYRRFSRIEEVNVLWNDGEAFGNASSRQAMADFLRENYVVDMKGPIVGSGTRVVARELKPMKFPLPYPEKDELDEGLRINIPNRFLVVRLTKDSYKDVLGSEVVKSEQSAIVSFLLASESLFFPAARSGPDGIRAETGGAISEMLALEVMPTENPFKKSFIPPLMIIRAQIGEYGHSEYMTVQKKVLSKGTVLRGEVPMYRDMLTIPGFRDRLRQFVQACKNFHAATGLLPDTVGHGNVLYTKRGNVYLVDINNITPEPHYRLIALLGLCKELKLLLENPNLCDERRQKLESHYQQARKEFFEEMSGQPKFDDFCSEEVLDRLMTHFYVNPKDRVLNSFFRAAQLVDDLSLPIFCHNISNLLGLEMDILRNEAEAGLITEEERKEKLEYLEDTPLYRPLSSSHGPWKGKRCFCFDDILDNKSQGHENWIGNYMSRIYCILNNDGMSV